MREIIVIEDIKSLAFKAKKASQLRELTAKNRSEA
jgi:hypothetical protein